MAYGKLRAALPGNVVHEFAVDLPSVFIGRGPQNGIVLDDLSVSPRHARLTIDSGRLMVEDLGSESGTFVGGVRMASHSPQRVEEGQAIRFGNVECHHVAEGRATPEVSSRAAAAGASEPAAARRIQVTLTAPAEPIAPGSAATASLSLRNLGRVVDELEISVPDLPPDWVRLSRPSVTLLPGATEEVALLIQPPRDPSATAGIHAFTVLVHSREQGTDVADVGSITIQPFGQATVVLQPARAKRDFRVVAENSGNEPVTLALKGIDDEEALLYEFAQESVTLPPGSRQQVIVRVRTRQRKLTGMPTVKPFRIEARAVSSRLAPVLADGTLQSEPPLRSWKWPIVGLVAAGAIGGGAVGYTQACPEGLSECVPGSGGPDDTNTSAANAGGDVKPAVSVAASASASPSGTPRPSPSASASASASASPATTASPSPSASPSPKVSPSPAKPSPSPSPPASKSPTPKIKTYTTVIGDTCQSVALKHSISVATLAKLNGLSPTCGSLRPGITLKLE